MRILTYCYFRSNVKGVSSQIPFDLEVTDIEILQSDVDEEFIKRIVPGIDWNALLIAAKAINLEGFPEVFDSSILEDDDFLTLVHHLLINVQVVNGTLICKESNKRFPIINRIPNLV